MSIVKTICAPFSKNIRENADIERRITEDKRLFEEFRKDPLIAQYDTYNINKMFNDLQIDAARGEQNVDAKTGMLTIEQLKVHSRLQKEFLKNLRKLPGKNVGLFRTSEAYLKSEIFKINPTMKKAFTEILRTNDRANGRNQLGQRLIGNIIDDLKIASNEYAVGSFANKIGNRFGSNLKGKLDRMNKRYLNIARGKESFQGQKGPTAAKNYYMKGDSEGGISQTGADNKGNIVYIDSLDYLTKEGELKAFRDFSLLAVSDKKTFADLMADGTIHPSTKKAAKRYRELAAERDKDVLKGIKRLRSTLEKTQDPAIINNRKLGRVKDTLDAFSKNVESKMKSKDSGIMPILTLEILPQIEGNFYKAFSGNADQVDKAMDGFLALDNIMQSNLYTSKVIKNDLSQNVDFNFNIFPLLESYNTNSVKFLHSLENSNSYMDALHTLSAIKKNRTINRENVKDYEDFDNSVEMLTKYMSRLFDRQSSISDNPMKDRMTRMATNFQFFSKLGFNFKTAAKNATQASFNFMYFGVLGTSDLKKFKKSRPNLQTRIKLGREESGVFYVNIGETYGDMKMPIEKGPDGNYRVVTDDSIYDRADKFISDLATTSGYGMQAVENQINRNSTYDYAYTKEWIRQENTVGLTNLEKQFEAFYKGKNKNANFDNMRKNIKEDRLLSKKSNEYAIEFDKYRQKRAQKYADRIVKFLHYDYSQSEKSFAQTSRLGSVALQFKHYVFSNFIMQKKIIQQGVGDITTGQVNTEAVGRMSRLGGMYLLVDYISDYINIDFTNLFENAALEESKRYIELFNTDKSEKEVMQEFFGRGPIAGSLGPTFGTILDAAQIAGYDKIIRNNDMLGYMLGMSDASRKDGDVGTFEKIVQMTNRQVHKFGYETGPSLLAGDSLESYAGTIGKNAFGLYPMKKDQRSESIMKLKQEISGKAPKSEGFKHLNYTSSGVQEALNNLERSK